MSRENYFLELGLSFDPIENDLNIINKTIEKKRMQWSRGMNHPTKGVENKRKLTEIPKMIEVMTNEALRREEALNAQKHIQNVLKDKLEVVTAKGFITNEEIKLISTKYSIEERYIRKYINVSIKDEEKKEEPKELPVLDNSILNNIESNLKIINKKDLYDFLGLQPFTPKALLLNKAKEISRNTNMNSNKTAEITAMATLAGICISVFETEEQKKKYNNSLEKMKFKFVDEYIEIAAISGEIHPEAIRSIIEQAIKRKINEKTIKLYIKEYCKKNGIFVNGLDLMDRPTQTKEEKQNQEPSQNQNKTKSTNDKSKSKNIDFGPIMGLTGNTNGNIHKDGLAAISENIMYFRYKGGLYKSNIDGSSLTKLSDDKAISINVAGEWIFYKVGRYVYRMKTDGSNKEILCDRYLDSFILHKGYIYGTNGKDVIKINISTGEATTIFTASISDWAIYLIDNYIYYFEKSLLKPHQLCRRNLNGDDFKVILKEKPKPEFIAIDEDNKGFYYKVKNEDKTVLIDGKETVGQIASVLVTGIYYNEYNYRSTIEFHNNKKSISILKGNQRYIDKFDIEYEGGDAPSHNKAIVLGNNILLYKSEELQAIYRIKYSDIDKKLIKINLVEGN